MDERTLTFSVLSALPLLGLAQQRPNVVLIVADDLGYGDVSAYGQGNIPTPNIDRLANGGVCFTDGHACSATSTPSRYALFTGMYPWKKEGTHILPGDAPLLIPTTQFTMPRMFKQAGYSTAAIGKWHLGMGIGKIDWNKEIRPGAMDIGFDYSYIIAATVDRVPTVYVENGRVAGLDPSDPLYVDYDHPFEGELTALTNPELVKMKWSEGHQNTVVNGIPRIGYMKGGVAARWDDTVMAQHLVDKVTHYIDTVTSSKPFFLYYGLHEPHVPRVPDKRFEGATPLGPRGDVVVEADWCVGQVIAKLEEKGLLENTIIIFTSDNGPVLDDGYQDGSRDTRALHDPNGGYRGGKYSLFDAGTRVPFFVYWKGVIPHVVNHELNTQLDLLASFGAMLHAKLPIGLDSKNRLATFMGRNTKGRGHMVIEAGGRLAFRSGSYALLPPYKGPQRNATGNEMGVVSQYSLYDLRAEPAQHNVISEQKPAILKKMKSRFLKMVGSHYQDQTRK